MKETILKVKNLAVSYTTYRGKVRSVRGLSFKLKKGET
jgi:ABC-type dipeptide/oligopeptide/nickel transport system ATPase component